jgi:diguanylate cyclase (GGDEF)-like protein
VSESPLVSVAYSRTKVDHFNRPIVLFDENLHLIYRNHLFISLFGAVRPHFAQIIANTGPISSFSLSQHINQRGYWLGAVNSRFTAGIAYQIRVRQLPGSDKVRFIGLFEQVGTMTETSVSLQHMADELTGLPNRYAFFNTLNSRIQMARGLREFAVLYIDLDHFKDINELYGHNTGDELLRYSSERIRGLLRRGDKLGRLAGDEFAAIIAFNKREELDHLCDRLLRLFDRPVMIKNRSYQVTISIGVVFYPDHGHSPEDIVIHAEKAMFVAKQRGRAQFQIFDQKQSQQVEQKQRLAEALRRELRNHPEQFRAAYQPLYSLQNGECIGMEVLARWHSPEFGGVSPGEFIPLAESRGLINNLSARLFDVVLQDLSKGIMLLDRRRPILAVNVSAQQIISPLFERMLMRLSDDIVRLGWQLEVELTESQLMSQTDALIEKLSSWRQKGIRIAIDDFGTGYSCLAYLHLLPVDKLKIDRQFLQSKTKSRSEDKILYAILRMAHALNIDVLAEGVETSEQFQRLLDLGCEAGQGFGLARPQQWSPDLMKELWTV